MESQERESHHTIPRRIASLWHSLGPTRLIGLSLLLLAFLTLLLVSPDSPATTPQRLPTRITNPTPTSTPPSVTARAYYAQGLAYQETSDVESALQSFTWAIQRAPDFAPAYVARGAIYLAQGELRPALAETDAALAVDPANAAAHALRGEILRLQGHHRRALKAFDQAALLDPAFKEKTFRARWLAARALADDGHTIGRASNTRNARDRLLALSREYALAHPDDPIRHYYRAWRFIESGEPRRAVHVLVRGIETSPEPPALLWFALGEAYAAQGSWQNALTAFEAGRALAQTGDTSLFVHSDQPVVELFGALGQAYMAVGRCMDAETMLRYALDIGGSTSKYRRLLEEARLCQTPTPTITPYPTTTPPGR